MKKIYQIGLYPNSFGSAWHGGQIYFDNLIALLSEPSDDPVELVIIENERTEARAEKEKSGIPRVVLDDYVNKEKENTRQLRKEAKRTRRQRKWWDRFLPRSKDRELSRSIPPRTEHPADRAAFAAIASDFHLDFMFPLPSVASGSGVKGAAWIPDLQHCFLPELFEKADIESRDEMFRSFSESGLIIFSSETSRDEFRKRYPEAAAKLEVWSFCSNPGNDLFAASPSQVVDKYRLPERFFLVANQFWKHKDHVIVVEALIRLKREGLSVPVVFTGALRDYRGTGHIDEFLQSIQRGGINDSVHLLGFLDRSEQLHLMRSALAVIQPSRFEGWSTVVEDGKALGQRLILSDLDVHREQNPSNSKYFPVGDARTLAEKMREFYENGAEQWLKSREARESQARSDLLRVRAASRKRFLEIVELSQEGKA